MDFVNEFLKSNYEKLLDKKIDIESQISKLDYELEETKNTVNKFENMNDSISNIFSSTPDYYENKKFSEEETQRLTSKISEIELEIVKLEKVKKDIDEELSNNKEALNNYKENVNNYAQMCISMSIKCDIDKEIDKILEKIEFCKKIAICDPNRNVQELDKIVRKLKKISKLMNQ